MEQQPLIRSNPLKWLEQNYERHNITTLANMLNVTVIGVQKMLLMIGIDIELSPEQKTFIKTHYHELTVSELVSEMNVPGRPDNLLRKKVNHFIKIEGLKKEGVTVVRKVPIKRSAPDHTNMNHHDRVTKWMLLSETDIRSHKGMIKY